MKTTCTMPSANGVGAVKIENILDEGLGTKCGLYANSHGTEDFVFIVHIVNV